MSEWVQIRQDFIGLVTMVQVLTQLLPLGYAIGKYLPTDLDELKKRCDKYASVTKRSN